MARRAAHLASILAVALLAPVLSAIAFAEPRSADRAPPQYRVEFLPNPDPDPANNPLRPSGINERGTVTGTFDYPYRAFVSNGRRTILLPNLSGKTFGFGEEINDRGQVAGSSGFDAIEDPQRAVRWVRGQPQDLGTLGGTDSFGYSINNKGHVVGGSYVSPSTTDSDPFLWTPSNGMVNLAPGPSSGRAFDVNELDEVAGTDGSTAFLWRDGGLQYLGAPPGFSISSGLAINESGQVAGNVDDPPAGGESFARHTDGVGWETFGGRRPQAAFWGINDRGDAVGVGTSGGFDMAFVYIEGEGLFLLDALLATDGWTILAAYDINNAGQIAAYASSTQGPPRAGAVRLTPVVQEP